MIDIDSQIKQEIYFQKYKYISIYEFEKVIKDLYTDIMNKIYSKSTQYNNKQLQSLLSYVKKELDIIYNDTEIEVQKDIEELSSVFLLSENKMLGTKFDDKLLDSIYDFENDYVQGYTFSELFQTHNQSTYNNIKRILSVNLLEGNNPKEFSELLYDKQVRLSRSQMLTSARTYSKHLRDKIQNETEKNLKDLKGRMSLSTLDSRTSATCVEKDKEFYDIKKYKNRKDIPNRPPRHFNCRSILVRITENTLHFTRAANGDIKGQVDTRTTFNSFLKRNPKTAEELLGKSRYELFKTERYNIKDFIDNGEWKTIEDLKDELL